MVLTNDVGRCSASMVSHSPVERSVFQNSLRQIAQNSACSMSSDEMLPGCAGRKYRLAVLGVRVWLRYGTHLAFQKQFVSMRSCGGINRCGLTRPKSSGPIDGEFTVCKERFFVAYPYRYSTWSRLFNVCFLYLLTD